LGKLTKHFKKNRLIIFDMNRTELEVRVSNRTVYGIFLGLEDALSINPKPRVKHAEKGHGIKEPKIEVGYILQTMKLQKLEGQTFDQLAREDPGAYETRINTIMELHENYGLAI
jgi:hypothetical protein